jgi:UPF0716 protein FxsA
VFVLLIALFIVVPIAELYVIIQVGQLIGVWPTIGLLLLDSILGSLLLRWQGRAVWQRFNQALAERRMPHKEVIDGVLVILGGALLLTPGFITDIFGLLLLIPPTRAVVRRTGAKTVIGRLLGAGRVVVWGGGRARDAYRRPPREGYADPGQGRPRPADLEGTAHEVPEPGAPGSTDGEQGPEQLPRP